MTATDLASTALAPIALDELLEVASLQTRLDRKYLIPTAQLAELTQAHPGARILTIDGATHFGYASRYLDTPDLEAYRLAAHGRLRRYKVRWRTYLDSGDRFLEVKTRSGRGLTVKDRLEIADGDDLMAASRFAPRTVHDRTGRLALDLSPALDVDYRRSTMLLPSGARVTVDQDLTWRAPHAANALHLTGHVVVETKTAGAPCEVDTWLWRRGIRPVRLSKYACGLALTRGEPLPANRWHRTLRTLTTWSSS